uniref:Uncharacterized protein n=1 Tax=Romanomermis culicivorax TaxID=13658 RepID=A0A915JVS6_ROMCU
MKVYKTMLSEDDTLEGSKLDAIASASLKVAKQHVDIRKLIMDFPGPIFTSSFICHNNRKFSAQEVVTYFKHLGTYKVGDICFVGFYKELGVLHNLLSLCFFKVPKNMIKQEIFDEVGYSSCQYEVNLNLNISNEPPAKLAKLSDSWQAFYNELKEQYDTYFGDK